MGASIIIFSFFLLCFLCFPHLNASVENCLNHQCSKDEPIISYPFRIKGRQSKGCGYPGFDLTCDNMNRTVLELPFTEPFVVRNISYDSIFNEIQLQDPDNCVVRRFLNQLNLSGTPFIGIHYKNNSFFSCQSHTYKSSEDVRCLRNSTHGVFAIPSEASAILSTNANCTFITSILVPFESNKDMHDYGWFHNDTDIHLTWNWKEPYCKRSCNETSNFPYFRDPNASRNRNKILLSSFLSIFIGLPLLIVIICFFGPKIIKRFRG